MLLITSADEYLGFCVTSHLAQTKSLCNNIRVLCDSQSKYQMRHSKAQPWLLNFASKGIDVQSVDYMHPHNISQAMRNIKLVIITMGSHPNRVKHCKHLVKIALQSNVRSIILLSHIGGHSEQHRALFDYGLVENDLVQQLQAYEDDNNLSVSYTVLRLDWIQQYLLLWSTEVEHFKRMSLPITSNTQICPIDISDVCRVISNLLVKDKQFLDQLDDYHAGQVYTLTGPEALTCQNIVQHLSIATGYKHYQYYMARSMDTCFYLENLDYNIWVDERIKKERSALYFEGFEKANSYTTKVLSVPNGKLINL
jgi:hypothetical protein